MIYTENAPSMRDNRGRFKKGHKPLIRPKYNLMKKYPKIICDKCYLGKNCPDYHQGCVCAHKREFKRYTNRNLNYVIEELRATIKIYSTNMQFYFIKEIISGEYSPQATKFVKKNFKRLLLLYQIYEQIDNSNSTTNLKRESIIDKLFGDIIT